MAKLTPALHKNMNKLRVEPSSFSQRFDPGEGPEALLFESESGNRAIVLEDKLRAVFHAGRFPFLCLSWLTLDNISKMEPSCFII